MRRDPGDPWLGVILSRAVSLARTPRPPDVVVRCGSRAHRVRLGVGRFWASARCRACGARVDPTRVRRLARWAAGTLRPPAHRGPPLYAWIGTLAYLLLSLAAAACVWLLADHWWPATTLLFGPRWILLLPLAALVPAVLVWDRVSLVTLAVATIVMAGPVVGLRAGWRRLFVSPDTSRDLRVMSFNADGGSSLRLPLPEMVREWRVDVAAIQECGGALQTAISAMDGWSADVHGSLCLLSRLPIRERAAMEREALEAAGGSGLVETDAVEVGERLVHVTNVHLETPRAGFEQIRAGRVGEGAPKLQEKSLLREIEQRRARRWAAQYPPPRIALGDFNSPPESPIFRAAWAGWQNAFSRMGIGLGGTRLNGWIRARIDHILLDDSWTVVRSWLGPDVGSDHRPILAEVRLRD